VEALYAATAGEPGRLRTTGLLARVDHLAQRLQHPHLLALSRLAAGVAEIYRGRFVEGLEACSEAETLLRERCTGVAWELSMARTFVLLALQYLGDLERLSQHVAQWRHDAEVRDDRHAAVMLSGAYEVVVSLLAQDRLETARAQLARCVEDHGSSFDATTFRYVLLLSQVLIELYAGDGPAAWRRITEHFGPISRSLMLSKQPFRIWVTYARGRAALAAAQAGVDTKTTLRAARKARTLLHHEGAAWAEAFGLSLEGGLRAFDGDAPASREAFAAAAAGFESLAMHLHAAAARRRLGELEGGAAGHLLIQAADAAMAERGARNPGAVADALVAGTGTAPRRG
jgi:hypothetical protein